MNLRFALSTATALMLGATGCGSDDLGGAVGRWRCISHYPTQNSTPFSDDPWTSTLFWLHVEQTGPGEGRVRICGPLGVACPDAFLDGPASFVDDLLVWRLEFENDAFTDPDFDCVIHERFHAVLLPEGDRMNMISNAEYVELRGPECDEAEEWSYSLEGSQPENPMNGGDITQYYELVRR